MPILDLQQRITERGRIRLGTKVEGTRKDGSTYTRPSKSSTFLVSSHDRTVVDLAAAEWADTAGRVEEFDAGWRVDTGRTELDVILPPEMMSFSQWREMWGNGYCARRCDGQRETISDGPCLCPADHEERRVLASKGKACKDTTRLSVMLPDLPGFGLWRVESHGFYAASELAGAVQAVTHLAPNTLVRARLTAAAREVVRFDSDGNPKTHKFVVPTLDLPDVRLRELIAPDGGVGVQIEAPTRRALTPVAHAALTETTGLSVAEQLAQTKEAPRRRSNAAALLPSTGLEPGGPPLATPEHMARIDELLPLVPQEAMPTLKAWKAEAGISMKAGEFTADMADEVIAKLEELASSLPADPIPTASAGAGSGDDKGTDDGATTGGVGETLTVPEVSGGGDTGPVPPAGVASPGVSAPDREAPSAPLEVEPAASHGDEVGTAPAGGPSTPGGKNVTGGEARVPEDTAGQPSPSSGDITLTISGPVEVITPLKDINPRGYQAINRKCRAIHAEHGDPDKDTAASQWEALAWACSGARTTHLGELSPDEASVFRTRMIDVSDGRQVWVESNDPRWLGWTLTVNEGET